jgi:hypothetical protein
MTRKRALFVGLAALATAAGAGLCLAQNTTNTIAAPPVEAPPPEAAGPAAAAQAPAANAVQAPAPPPAEPAGNTTTEAPAAAKAPDVPATPPKRPRYTTAVLQALDKVTAETLRFEAKVNEPVRYKDLVITVHACETNASDEPVAEAAAHLDVQYQPDVLQAGARTARRIYRGWMFANAPGLHPLQHPIYDLWVIACRTPSPAAPPAPAPAGASL